jgi:hypothetical protein
VNRGEQCEPLFDVDDTLYEATLDKRGHSSKVLLSAAGKAGKALEPVKAARRLLPDLDARKRGFLKFALRKTASDEAILLQSKSKGLITTKL